MNQFDQLPPTKQQELTKIVSIIKKHADVEMIILFGSFARGDWVNDRYMEGHITYEYMSDFDILVAVKSEKLEKNFGLWNEIETEIRKSTDIDTPVSLLVDTIHFINKRLGDGNYFYNDIRKEGIVLFDTENFKLAKPRVLNPQEQKDLAQVDFDFWSKRARAFMKDFHHNIDDEEWNNAAFHLHQATEAMFVAILLVFTGYKPKTHDLEKIEDLIKEILPEIEEIFPKDTPENKRLYELLQRAYVDARYRPDYVITSEELEQIAKWVGKLEEISERFCKERIKSFDLQKS